jgi:hypothetical protein
VSPSSAPERPQCVVGFPRADVYGKRTSRRCVSQACCSVPRGHGSAFHAGLCSQKWHRTPTRSQLQTHERCGVISYQTVTVAQPKVNKNTFELRQT